ncbi:thioredoxin-dependent thiol peroxidase [bacterium]|nr:thioredoxin-dependent thiol peroxidase [bacterium]
MIEAGDKAPAFSLPSEDGKISLKDFKGKKVVLYFYPKDLTPGCTQQACDFRDALPKFKKKGTVILGVSRDPLNKHTAFREKYDLNFALLSDEDGKVCEAYGVWKEKSLYGRKFMGIERSTFVIDEKGTVRKVFRKVKVKDHAPAVLEALAE